MDQRGPDDDATTPITPEPATPEPVTPEPEADATAAFDPNSGFDPFKESEAAAGDDETAQHDPTHVLPTPATPAWAGRAGVPTPAQDRLRDSAPYAPAEPPPTRTWWTPVLLGMLALGLVGVVVLVAWMMGRDKTPEPGTTLTATAVPTTAPPTAMPTSVRTPTATPTVQLVQIPAGIVGMMQAQATKQLDGIGLSYTFEFAKSPKPEGEVIATKPEPGALVPAQSTVTLVISLGEDPKPTPTPTPTSSPTP